MNRPARKPVIKIHLLEANGPGPDPPVQPQEQMSVSDNPTNGAQHAGSSTEPTASGLMAPLRLTSYTALPLLYFSSGQLESLMALMRFWALHAPQSLEAHSGQVLPHAGLVLWAGSLRRWEALDPDSRTLTLHMEGATTNSLLPTISVDDVSKARLDDLGLDAVNRLCLAYDQEVAVGRAQPITWQQVRDVWLKLVRLNHAQQAVREVINTEGTVRQLMEFGERSLSQVMQPPTDEEQQYLQQLCMTCMSADAKRMIEQDSALQTLHTLSTSLQAPHSLDPTGSNGLVPPQQPLNQPQVQPISHTQGSTQGPAQAVNYHLLPGVLALPGTSQWQQGDPMSLVYQSNEAAVANDQGLTDASPAVLNHQQQPHVAGQGFLAQLKQSIAQRGGDTRSDPGGREGSGRGLRDDSPRHGGSHDRELSRDRYGEEGRGRQGSVADSGHDRDRGRGDSRDPGGYRGRGRSRSSERGRHDMPYDRHGGRDALHDRHGGRVSPYDRLGGRDAREGARRGAVDQGVDRRDWDRHPTDRYPVDKQLGVDRGGRYPEPAGMDRDRHDRHADPGSSDYGRERYADLRSPYDSGLVDRSGEADHYRRGILPDSVRQENERASEQFLATLSLGQDRGAGGVLEAPGYSRRDYGGGRRPLSPHNGGPMYDALPPLHSDSPRDAPQHRNYHHGLPPSPHHHHHPAGDPSLQRPPRRGPHTTSPRPLLSPEMIALSEYEVELTRYLLRLGLEGCTMGQLKRELPIPPDVMGNNGAWGFLKGRKGLVEISEDGERFRLTPKSMATFRREEFKGPNDELLTYMAVRAYEIEACWYLQRHGKCDLKVTKDFCPLPKEVMIAANGAINFWNDRQQLFEFQEQDAEAQGKRTVAVRPRWRRELELQPWDVW